MNLAELDAPPDAAMILLTSDDWTATIADRPLVQSERAGADHVVFRDMQVWVVSPAPSRVLSADQMRSEELDLL